MQVGLTAFAKLGQLNVRGTAANKPTINVVVEKRLVSFLKKVPNQDSAFKLVGRDPRLQTLSLG